jgi:hypothetical protein
VAGKLGEVDLAEELPFRRAGHGERLDVDHGISLEHATGTGLSTSRGQA